jgi:tRNA(Ile)-lysidine synthase
VNEFLQRIPRLLAKGEPALVGVSAGVDSMVLLHLLGLGWNIQVAHLNHRLRGKSSDADERLVRKTAEKLNLPCHVERADVKAVARKQKLSIEMAARQCRHEFFARLAAKFQIRKIALAHHADDQVELFFLRLLRGAGPQGLAGMPEMSPSSVDPSLTIIRPLLGVTKRQIRAYATEHKIPFREDATNASIAILRNRIRHKLIPLLNREYQPGVTRTILRVMDLLREESDFVSRWGERTREPFDQLPIALQRRRLQQQLYTAGIDTNFDLIEHLRLNPKMPIMVTPQQTVARDSSGTLQVSEPTFHWSADSLSANACDWTADSLSTSIARPGSIDFSGVTIRWSSGRARRPRRAVRAPAILHTESFDADKIGRTIILRRWQPGDRFHPIGMPRPVKLQDLFTNLKIPRARRHRLIVATTAKGEIFWVEGLRISEPFKLTPSTTRPFHWSWHRHDPC